MRTLSVLLALSICACSTAGGPDPGGDPFEGSVDAEPPSPTAPDAGAPEPERCTAPGPAIVTDIDATLTTSDLEWVTQILIGTHDPAERAGGAEMINAYADRGYYVLYLTARPETFTLGFTGETATDATWRWLTEHGYPIDPERTRLQLAPELVSGDATVAYKSGTIIDMQAEGFTFDFAYGNAATDIDGYELAGIAKDVTFVIGPEAGTKDTVAIQGEDWLEHTATHVAAVAAVCVPD